MVESELQDFEIRNDIISELIADNRSFTGSIPS